MKRSDFLRNAALVSGAALTGNALQASEQKAQNLFTEQKGKTFKLNYAPHQGMFQDSAGKNFLDEIQYFYDLGFRAIEDNGYLGRSVEEQEKNW